MKPPAVLAAVFTVVVFVAMGTAMAQPGRPPRPVGPPEPPLPPDTLNGPSTPAPDWLVWRAFHDSLQFYQRRSPKRIPELLLQRADLENASADAVLAAGQDYLEELSRIDDEARAEIRARYQPNASPRFPPPDPSEVLGGNGIGAPAPSTLISARTQDGRKLYDVLVTDGFIAHVEQRKQTTFRAHAERLRRMIGAAKLAKLEEWIRADVAPRVKVGTRANLVPSPRGAESRRPDSYVPVAR